MQVMMTDPSTALTSGVVKAGSEVAVKFIVLLSLSLQVVLSALQQVGAA